MRITAGTQPRRILAYLQRMTGEGYSFREVERFRSWWIDNMEPGSDTNAVTPLQLLKYLEIAGI